MKSYKSYTDLEQSRKLVEILPIESADMRYFPLGDNMHPWVWTDTFIEKEAIPCWSLAALLSVLPANKLEKQFDGKWWFSVYLPSGQHKSHKHDNPIDACVEVILNLHKLNLL